MVKRIVKDHMTIDDLTAIAEIVKILRPYMLRPERLLRIFNCVELYVAECLNED